MARRWLDRIGDLPDSDVPKGSNRRREEASMRSFGVIQFLVLTLFVGGGKMRR
jgi:hypothetical protein